VSQASQRQTQSRSAARQQLTPKGLFQHVDHSFTSPANTANTNNTNNTRRGKRSRHT
jgi:hypothetical protein